MEKARIFIVEDDRIISEDIKSSLTKQGFTVSGIAFSGKDAIRKIEQTRPDLVLMDIMLHGKMNGIEVTEFIVSKFNIPVVYLTAYIDDTILEQAKLTTPYGYIIKPFEDSELKIIIEIALYKHKMEMKIKESEAWLSTTLKSIGDAVIATDPEYHIVFTNPAAQTLTGWTAEQTAGKSLEEIFNIINKKTGKRLKKPAGKVLREIKTITGKEDEIILIQNNGNEIPINFGISIIKDDKGNEIGVVLTFRDITERKKAEEKLRNYQLQLEEMVQERTKNLQMEIAERRVAEMALRDSENRYRNLVDHLPDIIYIADKNGILKFINNKGLESLESDNSELIENPLAQFIHPDDAKALIKTFHKVHTTGIPVFDYKCRFISGRGRIFPVVQNITLLKNLSDGVIGVMCIAHDISALQQAEDRLRKANEQLENRVLERTEELKKTNEKLGREIEERKLAEKALYDSELRYRSLVEHAPDIIMNLDPEGNIIFINRAPMGAAINDLTGKNVFNFVPAEYHDLASRKFSGTIATGEPADFEIYGRMTGRWFSVRLGAIINNKTTKGATVIATDITERKSAEDLILIQRDIMAALGSTENLAEAFDLILRILLQRDEIDSGGMYLVNSKGEVDFISHTGFTPEFLELVRHYSPDTPQAQLIREGKAFYQLYNEFSFSKDSVRRREGLKAMAIIPICHLGKPVACINLASHTKNDIPINFRNMLESLAAQLGEIIIRIQTREALENSEFKFATAFKSSASMMTISTLEEGRYIEVNNEFLSNLGYERDELIGKTSEELQIFTDLRQRDTIKEIAVKYSFARNFEVTLKAKSGVLRYCLFSAHVIKLNDEPCLFAVAHDITERMRMETFLHIQHDLNIALSGVTEIKEALNLVLEAGTRYEDINAGGIYLVNAENGGLDLVNSKNLSPEFINHTTHYDADENRVKTILKGMPIYISSSDSADKKAKDGEGLKSIAVLPIFHQEKLIACMNIASRTYDTIPDAARNFLESIASQVGGAISRLRFEKELQESEEKFRAITENSTDMIMIISIEGKYTYASPALVKLLGYFPDEIIGKTSSLYIYPDDLSLLEDAAGRSLEKPGAPISLRDFRAYKKNRDVIILSGTIINMLNIKGVEGIVGVFHDITERKRMEDQIQNHNRMLQDAIKKTERDMEELMYKHLRIEKLAAIGQIYGNIAHELRNPLGAIKQSVFFLKRKLRAYPDKIHEHLDLIDRELTITNSVISNMLTSIDVRRTNHKMVDLYPVIHEAVMRCKIDENISLTFNAETEKYIIPGDAIQLQQVFINLITNAVQSIEKAGAISISVKKPAAGDKIQIKIKDNGCGIESGTLGRVFTPLYTTKKNGTGLGLGICKQIIEQHGGEIDLQSKTDSGTIVTITFPSPQKNIYSAGLKP